MYILGISCYYRDAAACLLKDGEVIAAAEEERFTRIKHDPSFPINAIKFCLDYANIKDGELGHVVFNEKPSPAIKGALAIDANKILFCEHHLSHAASSFFCSPFQEAAILSVDGAGKWTTTSLGKASAKWDGKGINEIKLFEDIRFPHSLGFLYSVFTSFLGFEVDEGEYKVMGMSAFGEPKYIDKIYKLIQVGEDGSFRLNMRYFTSRFRTKRSFNKHFEELFGKPRDPESHFITDKTSLYDYIEKPTEEEIEVNQYYADLAASVQKVTEDVLIKIANHLYRQTGLKKLCLAGGVALNCLANSRLLKESLFDEIFIQPASGVGGGAMGAALYVYHCVLSNPRKFILQHAFWGKEYSQQQIESCLRKNNQEYQHIENEDALLDGAVDALISGKAIGWFQGRAEWGPRALGNRSILADPRTEKMKDIINIKIKFREPFRPFAPSVLLDYADKFFELNGYSRHYPLRFMLYTLPVKKKELIPAVTHIDGSSRIQVVDKESNPLFYRLIERFYQRTGLPVLLNTSFNLKGEPIVNSPEDAFSTFLKSGMDMLVMGEYISSK